MFRAVGLGMLISVALAAHGYGFEKRDVALAELLSAVKTEPRLAFDIGDYYQNETVDIGAALVWYRKAIAEGDKRAHYRVGSLYFHGVGVRRDFAKARHHLILSESVPAAELLAEMYFHGLGVGRDFAKAEAWLLLWARRGNELTVLDIGENYLAGRYPTLDRTVRAHAWLAVGEALGNKRASRRRRGLTPYMTELELAAASAFTDKFSKFIGLRSKRLGRAKNRWGEYDPWDKYIPNFLERWSHLNASISLSRGPR